MKTLLPCELSPQSPSLPFIRQFYVKQELCGLRRMETENQNWSELDRNGRIMVDWLLDQQDFYYRHGYVTEKQPASAVVD